MPELGAVTPPVGSPRPDRSRAQAGDAGPRSLPVAGAGARPFRAGEAGPRPCQVNRAESWPPPANETGVRQFGGTLLRPAKPLQSTRSGLHLRLTRPELGNLGLHTFGRRHAFRPATPGHTQHSPAADVGARRLGLRSSRRRRTPKCCLAYLLKPVPDESASAGDPRFLAPPPLGARRPVPDESASAGDPRFLAPPPLGARRPRTRTSPFDLPDVVLTAICGLVDPAPRWSHRSLVVELKASQVPTPTI